MLQPGIIKLVVMMVAIKIGWGFGQVDSMHFPDYSILPQVNKQVNIVYQQRSEEIVKLTFKTRV
jgi:hypothetical protein